MLGKLKFIKRLMDDPDLDRLYEEIKQRKLDPGRAAVEKYSQELSDWLYFHSWQYGVTQGMKLGSGHHIEYPTIFLGFDKITIGTDFVCGSFSNIRAVDATITIGNKVSFGQSVMVIGADHNYEDPNVPFQDQGHKSEPINIEDNVWVGAQATILKGVTIGKGSIIGAGSTVTSDIAPMVVAAGNPAKTIKKRE